MILRQTAQLVVQLFAYYKNNLLKALQIFCIIGMSRKVYRPNVRRSVKSIKVNTTRLLLEVTNKLYEKNNIFAVLRPLL